MSRKRKRSPKVEPDKPIKLPRKFYDEEMEKLLQTIMQYGHKNLDKIQEQLPGRSINTIKTFMRTVHDTAGKIKKNNEPLDIWFKKCEAPEGTPWRDCIQIAQVLKYLSVDGLLENHPLPERCGGIDFKEAYRLLYQAMMGYPIQPVSRPTADFVLEAFLELKNEIKKQTEAIKNLDLFLQKKSKNEEETPDNNMTSANNLLDVKKPPRVYQRKKPTVKSEVLPSLKITVEESSSENNSGGTKDFLVTVEGKDSSQSTTVNVPVVSEVPIGKEEEILLESSSYNPFQIPGKWLEQPLYLNINENV